MAQWNKTTQDYLNQERSLFEVNICADRYGNIDGCNGTASANSAFGESIAVPVTPVLQLDGLYGLETNKFETFTSGTGIVTSNTLMKASSGTGAYGYSVIRSRSAEPIWMRPRPRPRARLPKKRWSTARPNSSMPRRRPNWLRPWPNSPRCAAIAAPADPGARMRASARLISPPPVPLCAGVSLAAFAACRDGC